MMSQVESRQKFSEAKAKSQSAIDFFVTYFMENVEKQLQNLNFSPSEKEEKLNQCREVIQTNICTCYDLQSFMNQTLEDIKNVIYLAQTTNTSGSKNIVLEQKDAVRAILSTVNLDLLPIPVKEREMARLYYFGDKSVEEIAEICKCTETIVYVKLRKVATIVAMQKSTQNNESFLYR